MNTGFKKAVVDTTTRLKMLVYGDSGVGKTVTALSFPKPAVIDTERGTTYYGDKFAFDVLPTTSWHETIKNLEALVKDPNGYKTLVIDPFSILYDDLQEKHLKRQIVKSGNPN